MTFSLIDLNPSDGSLPSVTWSARNGSTYAYAHSSENGLWSNDDETYNAPSVTSVGGSNAVTIFATATSAYNNQSFNAAAKADTTSLPAGGYGNGYSRATAWISSNFWLSGAGVLVINLPYTIAVTGEQYNQSDGSNASLHFISQYSASDGFDGSADAYKSLSSHLKGNQSYSGVLTIAVPNSSASVTTSGEIYLHLDAEATADSETFVPSVPEPETYAMMLAGLGLIAPRLRRTSRKSV